MICFHKYIIAGLALAAVAVGAEARTAILMAHYGSSDDDTRANTVNMITSDVRTAFPSVEVRECYISPVVRKSMKAKGYDSPSPTEALQRLAEQGYDTVYVQSTTLIDGAEMADVRKATADMAPQFKHIATGRPLCYSPDDCRQLVDVLAVRQLADDEVVVYAGHGNNLPSTATYCLLDYMLHSLGAKNIHVSTIEGYPTAETTLAELVGSGARRVTLLPLLLVCGNHTRHDIAGEYADAVRAAGYEVEVEFRGLAENPQIRALYVDRVRQLMDNHGSDKP